jgi:hypothetical protein
MVRSRVAASRVLPTALAGRGNDVRGEHRHLLMAAPEFDKGTLARTQIGSCGQLTGLPDRRQAYGPSPLVKFLHSQRCPAYGHRRTTCSHRAMQVSGRRPYRSRGRGHRRLSTDGHGRAFRRRVAAWRGRRSRGAFSGNGAAASSDEGGRTAGALMAGLAAWQRFMPAGQPGRAGAAARQPGCPGPRHRCAGMPSSCS